MPTAHDSELLAAGQQVLTACAFIYQSFDGIEKVFVPRRAATKKFLPGVFELPGGHIDYGEGLVAGLKREIQEEFEMEVAVGDPFAAFTYLNEIKQSHSVEIIYFAKFTDSIENIVLHADDHSEYRWVSQDELPELYSEQKSADDDEFKAIARGFELLAGASPTF